MDEKTNEEKIKLISIVGPTASGKSDLCIKLAQKFNGEIVSADSMQVYKEFNILSAKPSLEELSKVKHHLIDFLPVSENFSVADFTNFAHKCIHDINKRGKTVFLAGGTGLYIDSLIKNLDFGESWSPNKEITEKLKFMDNFMLMHKLKEIDEKSAQKIHVNDRKRLIRAIEFFYVSGYPISVHIERSKNIVSKYLVCKIGLNCSNRALLYEKINSRVDSMLRQGLIEEVEKISKMNVSKTAQGAIGYKEVLSFVTQKEIDLKTISENLKRATRKYAKRQLTWFKRDSEINWIYTDKYKNRAEITDKCEDIIKKFI